MKKSLFVLCTAGLLFIGLTVSAQNFSIGPRLGVNFAHFATDNTTTKTNVLLTGGITSTYSINERTGIGVDLLYSQEGTARENGVDLKLNYLRLPVMFQYFFGDLGEDFRPKIYVGIVPGLLLNAKSGNTEVTNSYNNFDLAGTLGAGFNYRLSPKGVWLNADARYLRGFTDVDKGAAELFNQNFQLSLGVAFGID